MKFPFRLLITTLAVMTTIYILPGITAKTLFALAAVSILIALVNTVPKRLLLKLKIPMNLMVFGFLVLVINIVITYLASEILPGFSVNHFYQVIIFCIVVTGLTAVMNSFVAERNPEGNK